LHVGLILSWYPTQINKCVKSRGLMDMSSSVSPRNYVDETIPPASMIHKDTKRQEFPSLRPQIAASMMDMEIDPQITQRNWSQYNDSFSLQQCEAYTRWLNHIFQNPDVSNDDFEHTSKWAPLTLRAVSLHRRRAQTTQRAQAFFNSPEMQYKKETIEREVLNKRLSIRTDHDAFANVNLRSQMISLLMSYSTPWLRLGLETVFGEAISIGFAEKVIKGQVRTREALGIIQADPKQVS